MRPAHVKTRRDQGGFTLIEIIAVVFIIGITVSFAVLSIADRAQEDRLENEARRLAELLRLASDEAVLLGVELGLRSDGTQYQFMVISDEGAWLPYVTDGPLRQRKLPEGMQLEVTTEDFEPPPAEETKELPQLLFLSSGELSPFQLRLTALGADKAWQIEGELTGKIDLQPVDKDERP